MKKKLKTGREYDREYLEDRGLEIIASSDGTAIATSPERVYYLTEIPRTNRYLCVDSEVNYGRGAEA